jgi:hypothetical protein
MAPFLSLFSYRHPENLFPGFGCCLIGRCATSYRVAQSNGRKLARYSHSNVCYERFGYE